MNITTKMKESIANAWMSSFGSSISIYTGTIPAAGTVSPTGTKLVQLDSTSGLTVTGGTLNLGNFEGVATAAGTAGYACAGDSYSGYIYFTLGVSSGEFRISSTAIAVNDNITGNGSIVVVA
jgi:hypothetical protein